MSLISADELAARLDDQAASLRLRVLDVRWYLNKPDAGRAAYDAGHIPGAVFADLETDLSDPNGLGAPGRHPLPTPAAFKARMEALGIGSQMLVVGYDDANGTVAARLWWMLDNLGHRGGAAVLDGGLPAWTQSGRPLSTDEAHYPAARLELADEWHHVITREALAARLDYMTVLDARAGERYRGEVEPIDPVPGHIPSAVSAPAPGNLDADGRFLPPSQLRSRFQALNTGKPFVTSCGSGVVACHNALAMRQAGLPDPILYAGSYSDWTRSGKPVVAGAEPGHLEEDAA
ncbi:MAG: sulfurtransferase [Chloroflexota bacterium]